MNSIPVLKSKLIMPELSGSFLLTDRLKRLHKKMDSCRAVTICAPAGYGKTTLAVSYLNCKAAPSRVCWYRLDPEDKDLSVFIPHLSETVFPKEAPEFAESRKALEEYADLQQQPHHNIAMLCQEIWAYYGQSGKARTYIVLDDFQNVAQVQEICDMTRFLLDNLPPSCVIFLLTRADLEVFTEKQKLDMNILEIGTEDLAFSRAEIKDLTLSMEQTVIDKNLTDFIEKSTEGWIAGIIILCQAVKSKGPYTGSIERSELSREDALFRYMSLEVLKHVEGETQDALARLSVLQDFSEAEASEILQIGDIKSLIERCMGLGMFIQRIPGDPVVYRFHSLFREFLLYILKSRYTEEQVAGLHLRAAGYYIGHAIYTRAAEHLTQCGNAAPAMDMVTKVGFNKLMVGETGQLMKWLNLLPEDMIRENSVLLIYKALLMPNSRHPEIVGRLKNVLKQSLLDNRLEVYVSAATVLIYILICSNDMNGLLEMTADIPKKLQNASEELVNTLAMLDMVKSIGEDRLSMAEAQSECIVYAILPEDIQWLYLVISCIVYCCLGKLDHAERCIKTAMKLSNHINIEPARVYLQLFLTTVLSLKNEREGISSHISEIIATGEKYDYEYLVANGRRLSAFERYLSHETEASIEMLDYAVFYFRRMNNNIMAAACRLLQRLWAARQSGPAPDLEEAHKDFALIRKASPGLMVHETSLSIYGAIAREAGDFKLAERCLLSAIKTAKTKAGYQVLCGSCFHIARLYFAGGNTEQGHRYLKQAMELAAANRYFMFWDIHIPTLIEMALRGIRYGYCPDYAEELLGKFYGSKTVKYLIEKVKTTDESRITAFISDFISTYKADKPEQLYFVKASLFGKPEISVNGIKIPDTEWKTKKIKGFLEYLLLGCGNTISKETLAEIFWPGSDSKSAIASQRTALYYLRRILSKYNAEVSGNNALIHETLEGLQIRKNGVLELDLLEFSDLYGELSRLTGDTSTLVQKRADILERIITLYKGDLMEGSDYGDLVLHERERFKSIFMEACQKLSSIYIMRGELQKAEEILKRAISAEPYNENVCLELLNVYISQGRKSKAVKLYYSFRKRLEQELDIKVDKRLTEAIRENVDNA